MKGAKPFIPRHIHRPIIAIKKPVVKLMVEMPNRQAFFISHQERVKPGMPKHRPQGQRIEMKDNMHRMRWHNQMDQHR
jgi:hypothetical protein